MPASLQQVSDTLLRAGLVTETELSGVCETLEGAGVTLSGERLVEALHARGSLTAHQKEVSGSPQLVVRFQHEVRAAARLNHPNAVAAYDADECELGHFLVMEYVEGSDLHRIVKQAGPLGVPQAIDAIRQAAVGLAYAHSLGVIHRDIKPANLMRDVSGRVKIADLGLAGMDGAPHGPATTQTGWVAGTVDYMSPEQGLDTDAVDHRADVYSLGCTLYYLLTGRAVFEEETLLARMQAHRDKPAPSLRGVRADVPEALETIYQKMLAKRPQDRCQSMGEVARDLERLAGGLAAQSQWIPADSTILVVDSSRTLSATLWRYFQEMGADDIHVRASGEDGLRALERMSADVLVASIELPDMTGLALAQRIRNELRWSRVAIVLMTSNPGSRLLENLSRLGGVSLLAKPFDGSGLRAAVTQARQHNAIVESKFANVADLHVLIVDDSSVARRQMQRVLADVGFTRFSAAEDGTAALELLERDRYDLVVTDYNMPRTDGYELVSRIRHQSSQLTVPIILCTTEFDPVKLAAIYQLGVSAVCNKSFDVELVRNIVVRLFG